ncbi:MAG: FAD-dependent oxidoreductase [Euryarchaeota archaeon HGW-Euryarchaeota-1]|nr:MAG: FAD-dependent oxidoreductase [Euryarchaeota archaeon HGW-Euryarchaeota-1]
MNKKVVIIGGGIAGMESATYLSAMKYKVTILEKEDKIGGHLLKWESLFPTRRLGSEVVRFLSEGVDCEHVKVMNNVNIKGIEKTTDNPEFKINLGDEIISADAILITTGYDLFDARKKEEYGYGIYNNVITSADLEEIFLNNKEIKTASGKTPKRIGFISCVGSRDEKVGNLYCSQVCCITGVKQAVEIKEKLPNTEVFCFYMDLRMFGRYYEEEYIGAQEKGVNFIRGRLSEACENLDESIVIKVEDTLTGSPLKMNVDILVLLIGFVPSEGTKNICKMLNLELGIDNFIKTKDEHTMTNVSNIRGVFLAGACTGPKCITNTITDARAAAAKVASFLKDYDIEGRTTEKYKK